MPKLGTKQWLKRTLVIPLYSEQRPGQWRQTGTAQVTALCLGPLAVHPDVGEDENYSAVMHIHTLTRVVRVKSEKDATRICVFLHDNYLEAFTKTLAQAVRYRVPPTVVDWLKRCTAKSAWLDPE